MKRVLFLILALLCAPMIAPAASSGSSQGQFDGSDPVIESIRGKVVKVRVPAGFDRVTLQVRSTARGARLTQRGKAAQPVWKTVATKYPRGEAGMVNFRLARLTPKRNLRVFGNKVDSLPGSLLTGITSFLAEPDTQDSNAAGAPGGLSATDVAGTTFASADSGKGAPAEKRDVVESDIWKVNGDRLYFFNQLRGLQVFDITNADDPALLGTLRMPAVGEDMYLLDANHAVLLKQSTSWLFGGPFFLTSNVVRLTPGSFEDRITTTFAATTGAVSLAADSVSSKSAGIAIQPSGDAQRSSEVVVVDVEQNKPEIEARVEFKGSLRESRLVGRVLYIAADVYSESTDASPAEWGTEVTSFDLGDPAHPVQRASIHLGGWANAVMATDRFFFVAKWDGDYSGNVVDILDISAADGAMQQRGKVVVDGYVSDKFKMHLEDDVFTVVSQGWDEQKPQPGETWRRTIAVTKLATFSLADAAKPEPLGTLDIAPGETVRATRFDEHRAYVVTFVQIDPLWVIDLGKPSEPKVLGHVQAPGFSTYIEPLGDRLVTVGLVNWQPAVSLFDVTDGANPKLLSQVVLGSRDANWASSEATWNEKAFNVIPEENLILLPVSSAHEGDGYATRVQLLDLLENKIVKRGTISHGFYPRRSAVHNGRILSISPTKLVVVNAADRDNPVVTADIEIAWSVDRLFVVGKHLVQLGGDGYWSGNPPPTITISPTSNSHETLTAVDLPNRPIIGATVRDGVLYVLQSSRYYWDGNAAPDDAKGKVLSTFDVGNLPNVQALGHVTIKDESASWSSFAAPIWLAPHTLIWVTDEQWNSWWKPVWYDPPAYTYQKQVSIEDDQGGTSVDYVDDVVDQPGYWSPRWFYTNSKRLSAFDVTSPAAPKLASVLIIGEKQPWDVAAPFAANGSVFISHKHLGVLRSGDDYKWNDATIRKADASGDEVPDTLANRHFMQIIDYDDPATPVIRDEQINLPGRLTGLARNGQLLFTIGQGYDVATGAADPKTSALHVSAFDGTAAHLLDVLPLTSLWQPFQLRDQTVFLLKAEPAQIWKPSDSNTDPVLTPGANTIGIADRIWWGGGSYIDNPNKSHLQTFEIGADGKFRALDDMELDHESSLHLFGGLVVAQDYSQTLRLIDGADAANLRDLGTFTFEGWVWPQLDFADGDEERGLWVPLGQYGVEAVALPK